jgi:hypothetical protein
MFCDIVVKKVKQYLTQFREEESDYKLTMILQVFEHSSCRLASKYILKNFLESEELEEEEDIDALRQSNAMEARDFRFDSDTSSVFFVEKDFEKEGSEEELTDAEKGRKTMRHKARTSLYQVEKLRASVIKEMANEGEIKLNE